MVLARSGRRNVREGDNMWHKDDAWMDTKVTERTWSQNGPGRRAYLFAEQHGCTVTGEQYRSGCKTDIRAAGSNRLSENKKIGKEEIEKWRRLTIWKESGHKERRRK